MKDEIENAKNENWMRLRIGEISLRCRYEKPQGTLTEREGSVQLTSSLR